MLKTKSSESKVSTAQRAALPRQPKPAPIGAGIQLNPWGDSILGGVAFRFSYSEIYKVSDLEFQCPSYFLHVGESDILFGSLYHTNIGAMHLSEFSKPFLRIATLYAFFAYAFTKLGEDVAVHTYSVSVGSCYLWFYIL